MSIFRGAASFAILGSGETALWIATTRHLRHSYRKESIRRKADEFSSALFFA